jgi:glucans biosynthesis protein
VAGTKWQRVFFDLEVDGSEPIELRLRLMRDGKAITETWLYEYLPAADPIGAALKSRTLAAPE